MLAAHHDQENLVHNHPATSRPIGLGTRHLQQKAPATRFPKTPLKVPLNDENAAQTVGGKAAFGTQARTGGNVNSLAKTNGGLVPLVTPSGTRPRAPLGNKTTNAKARTGQTGVVKDLVREFEHTQAKAPTAKKERQKTAGAAPLKLEVRNDQEGALEEPDTEYVPPKPKDLPYESDVFPDGVLTFEGLKPENLLRGYYEHFYDPVDEDGVRFRDKEFDDKVQKALKAGEEGILQDIENTDWSVSDVPETKDFFRKKLAARNPLPAPGEGMKTTRAKKYPSTVSSRSAASALLTSSAPVNKNTKPSLPSAGQAKKSTFLQSRKNNDTDRAKTLPETAAAEAASRSTLGYTKGRSASSIVKSRVTLQRTASGASITSDGRDPGLARTSSLTSRATQAACAEDWRRPNFLAIFDISEDSDGDGLGGNLHIDLEDDDFQLTLGH